jgi:CheY-like chemotaxis protein
MMGVAPSGGLAAPLDGLTVLVIEDHPDSRDALRQVLASAGAEVVEAANGGRALDLLASARPDVILCDLLMPQVDGFTFMRRFRGGWPRTPVPVIAITALGEGLAILRETLAAGFDGHIAKPFDLDSMIAMVARAAGRGGREAAARAGRPPLAARRRRPRRPPKRRGDERQVG